MIYFDNAATTCFKPQCVIDAAVDVMKNYSVNPNRGASKKGAELEEKILAVRRKVAILLGAEDTNVVFTSNCTAALNTAILGSIQKGKHIITTATEHNSVLRPLMLLQNRKYADVSVVAPNEDGIVSADMIERKIRRDTYMVIVNHVSNVTGTAQNIFAIGKMLRKYSNVTFVVDAAQSVGYCAVDMKNCNVQLVAIPAHKGLHSIQGCGCLAYQKDYAPRPVVYGGTGSFSNSLIQPSTLPDGLEAGTQNCPAIVALGKAIDWWANNYETNSEKLKELTGVLYDNIERIPNLQLYSKPNVSGIAAFNLAKLDSSLVGDELCKMDYALRTGLHCAPLMHRYLNTENQGAVRISLSAENTKEEIFRFLNDLESVSKKLVN